MVPNPSFEGVSTCNVNKSFESELTINNWVSINSPDFFHTCFVEPLFAPPTVYAGNPFSKDNYGMAGIAMIPSTNHREGIGLTLLQPLEKD